MMLLKKRVSDLLPSFWARKAFLSDFEVKLRSDLGAESEGRAKFRKHRRTHTHKSENRAVWAVEMGRMVGTLGLCGTVRMMLGMLGPE